MVVFTCVYCCGVQLHAHVAIHFYYTLNIVQLPLAVVINKPCHDMKKLGCGLLPHTYTIWLSVLSCFENVWSHEWLEPLLPTIYLWYDHSCKFLNQGAKIRTRGSK